MNAMTFVVIDFEATTPTGHRPEPIEVATQHLRLRPNGEWTYGLAQSALMRPPEHAPVTAFDTYQTGITREMLAPKPAASVALAHLDLAYGNGPYLMVAHSAPVEAGILYDYRAHAPTLASTDLLDTVRLAKHAYPDLGSYSLDALIDHLQLPRPTVANRHRAASDVSVTAQLFRRVLSDGTAMARWRSLHQLLAVGRYRARANRSVRNSLFE